MTREELLEYDKLIFRVVNGRTGVRHSISNAVWPHYQIKVSFKMFADNEVEFIFGTWNTKKEAEKIIKEIQKWSYQRESLRSL